MFVGVLAKCASDNLYQHCFCYMYIMLCKRHTVLQPCPLHNYSMIYSHVSQAVLVEVITIAQLASTPTNVDMHIYKILLAMSIYGKHE